MLLSSLAVATVAGSAGGSRGSAPGLGPEASFDTPFGVSVIKRRTTPPPAPPWWMFAGSGYRKNTTIDGDVYISDSGANLVRKSTATLPPTPPAPAQPYSDSRYLGFEPLSMAWDAATGRLFVAGWPAIKSYDPQQDVFTTFAQGFYAAICSDPSGLPALFALSGGTLYRFSTITGSYTTLATGVGNAVAMAADAAGNIFLVDQGLNQIRKVTAGGAVSVYAGGNGIYGNWNVGSLDGDGSSARFFLPSDIAVSAKTGNVYVADTGNSRIRKIDPSGTVSTLAGSSTPTRATQANVNGVGTNAVFSAPKGLTLDNTESSLYFFDGTNGYSFTGYTSSIVVRIDLATLQCSQVIPLSDYDPSWASADSTSANVVMPLKFDGGGVLYGRERFYSQYLLMMVPPPAPPSPPPAPRSPPPLLPLPPAPPPPLFRVVTLAGSGDASPLDGVGTFAAFQTPGGVVADSSLGVLYVADTGAWKHTETLNETLLVGF